LIRIRSEFQGRPAESTFSARSVVLGRELPGRDVLNLPDVSVSRRHARVTLDDRGLWIEPLEAWNGVFLKGSDTPIEERYPVLSNDVFVVGETELRIDRLSGDDLARRGDQRVRYGPEFSVAAAAPATMRSVRIHRPVAPAASYEPDPELEDKEYEFILRVMRNAFCVMERHAASFATLDEENIRDHILLQLNGHYEGAATGETFNSNGKTDILIRVENRNIFIAECKFWHGPKKFEEAIEQLLGYLTWRDCKCALVVFNKLKNPSWVAQRMHKTMSGHKAHRELVSIDSAGNGRYVFVKESDPGRDIIITTQLFDVPS